MISADDYTLVYEGIQALPDAERDLLEGFMTKLAYDFIEIYGNPDRGYGEIVDPGAWLDTWLEEHEIHYSEEQRQAWIAGMIYGAKIKYEYLSDTLEGSGLDYYL